MSWRLLEFFLLFASGGATIAGFYRHNRVVGNLSLFLCIALTVISLRSAYVEVTTFWVERPLISIGGLILIAAFVLVLNTSWAPWKPMDKPHDVGTDTGLTDKGHARSTAISQEGKRAQVHTKSAQPQLATSTPVDDPSQNLADHQSSPPTSVSALPQVRHSIEQSTVEARPTREAKNSNDEPPTDGLMGLVFRYLGGPFPVHTGSVCRTYEGDNVETVIVPTLNGQTTQIWVPTDKKIDRGSLK